MMDNYISGLEKARNDLRDAKLALDNANREYTSAFKPKRTSPSMADMQAIYAICHKEESYSKNDIFVTIVLLLYAPEAIYGGQIKLELAEMMAKTIGRTAANIYMMRKRVSFWMFVYREFYDIIADIYSILECENKTTC